MISQRPLASIIITRSALTRTLTSIALRKMSAPASKRQKTSAPYELIYWPAIPGRGEFIRLCFEETKTPYTDVSNTSGNGAKPVIEQISTENHGSGDNPPPLAPPILRHGDLLISQVPNILLYLGPRLGLAGPEGDENAHYRINELALTALDGFSDEAHDTHHPVATTDYYENQTEETKIRSKDYIKNRLPKFLGYFERVLQSQGSRGGEWLYGGQLTWADLVLWQGLDGVGYAFPVAMKKLREGGDYKRVFALSDRVGQRDGMKEYLGSGRRLKYSKGIWRHYPDLDAEE